MNADLTGRLHVPGPQSRYILPQFEERTSYGMKRLDPYTKLFEDRIIFLGVQVDDASAADRHGVVGEHGVVRIDGDDPAGVDQQVDGFVHRDVSVATMRRLKLAGWDTSAPWLDRAVADRQLI